MISILQNNISKWSVQKGESALLITSPLYGVGSSTLSKKLSVQNNAKLIQIDTLRNFLRLNKFHFIEARGMNIIELEDKLLNDSSFRLTGEYDSFNEKDSVLSCINFLKEKRRDIYDDLINNPFGNAHYSTFEFDKYNYDSLIFNEYVDYLLNEYRNGNELAIIDGAVLLKRLSEDEELLNNAPIIIIDSDKFRTYFNALHGVRNQMKMYHPEISSIKAYCSILWKMFKQRKEANDMMNRGKLYQSYIKNSTDLYDPGNPNLITDLKKSTDYTLPSVV